ncbi:MAG: chromate transporter [Xenococcaceae cyanobacterium MO_207.B15]|nr:chromate transporter [Xenococcaceae cyanobacterium MO_207.B15]
MKTPPETIAYSQLSPQEQVKRLQELALVFLRLGVIAFGGPAAHIGMMDDEVVQRRKWMSREKLLDLMGITSLIPGPNSTELVIHIGYEQAGWRGLIVAGSCFIFPAMMTVWILAAIYVRYQTLPQVEWLLYGIKPVIIAVVFKALWNLGKKAAKDTPTIIAGLVATVAFFSGTNEIFFLLLIGVAVMLVKNFWHQPDKRALLLPLSGIFGQISTAATFSISTTNIFWFFLKVGSVLYGSGYVLLAFLQRDLVERNQWLTSQQLLDAVAIGQVTPGPIFTTATFIGYLLNGTPGAIAGTIGIFLPAFVLILIINPWVNKLRNSPWARGFLDGVNAASLGLMTGTVYILTRSALIDWLTVIVAITSIIVTFRFKINTAWLVLIGGMMGLIAKLLG